MGQRAVTSEQVRALCLVLREVIEAAWARTAPKKLVAAWRNSP
jgi:hypothetical protein